MAECFVRSFTNGSALGIVSLSKSFAVVPRTDLLHRAVRYETAWKAQNTEASKALGQVRGSTRKPAPQKGRGKARVGTLRAAHFVGGYAVHGPTPGAALPDIQRKVYDAAVRSAIATKFNQNQLVVVDSLALDSSSKLSLKERLDALDLAGKKCYFMYGSREPELNLVRAADQFTLKTLKEDKVEERRILVTSAETVSVLPVLENEFLVIDKAALEVLEEMYQVD
ncbi:ribosomal protein L4 [Rhizoclosmatium globosum]|uniref:Large ribosomal subunit protein uL4m n=1 Tax=Rhizoclosmatium globosum TaxID=329046 RepID=A0A1Y2C195_9FUNG|nr:ribosomal protein L4 [Rhizoclosmatium globosum]|eukprot:ORY40800.1 ribosomal protein L4 [Rhizoclosmatium globosum]